MALAYQEVADGIDRHVRSMRARLQPRDERGRFVSRFLPPEPLEFVARPTDEPRNVITIGPEERAAALAAEFAPIEFTPVDLTPATTAIEELNRLAEAQCNLAQAQLDLANEAFRVQLDLCTANYPTPAPPVFPVDLNAFRLTGSNEVVTLGGVVELQQTWTNGAVVMSSNTWGNWIQPYSLDMTAGQWENWVQGTHVEGYATTSGGTPVWNTWQLDNLGLEFKTPPLTDEQKAERAAQAEREQQRREEAARQRRVAAQRRQEEAEADEKVAAELLAEQLTDAQREDYEKNHRFELILPNGHHYRIKRGSHGNVYLLNAKGEVYKSFCIGPRGDAALPDSDTLLGQKLLLEADEDEFLRIANARTVGAA